MPTHEVEFSKYRNFSCHFTKRWFHHGCSPQQFQKFSENSTWSICGALSFQYNYPWLHAWFSCNLSRNFIHRILKEDATKIINCENLENHQENVYDKLYSSKFASLQCTGYNSTISRLYHRFFWNMPRKLPDLK